MNSTERGELGKKPGEPAFMDKLKADIIAELFEQYVKENDEEYRARDFYIVMALVFFVMVLGTLILTTIITATKEAVCRL